MGWGDFACNWFNYCPNDYPEAPPVPYTHLNSAEIKLPNTHHGKPKPGQRTKLTNDLNENNIFLIAIGLGLLWIR